MSGKIENGKVLCCFCGNGAVHYIKKYQRDGERWFNLRVCNECYYLLHENEN